MTARIDPRRRSCYLSVDSYTRLELVMTGIAKAVGAMPYLVGSCLTRPDYRDVDIRVPIEDDVLTAKFDSYAEQRIVQSAMSQYLSAATGLLIDFQWQTLTEYRSYAAGTGRPLGFTLAAQSRQET